MPPFGQKLIFILARLGILYPHLVFEMVNAAIIMKYLCLNSFRLKHSTVVPALAASGL